MRLYFTWTNILEFCPKNPEVHYVFYKQTLGIMSTKIEYLWIVLKPTYLERVSVKLTKPIEKQSKFLALNQMQNAVLKCQTKTQVDFLCF